MTPTSVYKMSQQTGKCECIKAKLLQSYRFESLTSLSWKCRKCFGSVTVSGSNLLGNKQQVKTSQKPQIRNLKSLIAAFLFLCFININTHTGLEVGGNLEFNQIKFQNNFCFLLSDTLTYWVTCCCLIQQPKRNRMKSILNSLRYSLTDKSKSLT